MKLQVKKLWLHVKFLLNHHFCIKWGCDSKLLGIQKVMLKKLCNEAIANWKSCQKGNFCGLD